jgi:hypothetical protein
MEAHLVELLAQQLRQMHGVAARLRQRQGTAVLSISSPSR